MRFQFCYLKLMFVSVLICLLALEAKTELPIVRIGVAIGVICGVNDGVGVVLVVGARVVRAAARDEQGDGDQGDESGQLTGVSHGQVSGDGESSGERHA